MLRLNTAALRSYRKPFFCQACLTGRQTQSPSWRTPSYAVLRRGYAQESEASSASSTSPPPIDATNDSSQPTQKTRPPGQSGPSTTTRGIKQRLKRNARKAAKDAAGAKQKDPNWDTLEQVASSLKHLEKQYNSISHKLGQLQQKKEEHTPTAKQAGDGVGDEPTPDQAASVASKKEKKLSTKLENITGTLNVLRSVLNSQHISIPNLRKASSQEKQGHDESGQAAKDAKKHGGGSTATADGAKLYTATRKPKSPGPSGPKPAKKASRKDVSPKLSKITKQQPSSKANAHEEDEEASAVHDQLKTAPAKLDESANVMSLAARLARHDESSESAKKKTGLSRTASAGSAAATPREGAAADAPKMRSSRRGKHPPNVQIAKADQLELTPIERSNMPDVPKLAHGLERVLFNPGVYHLQDPRSKMFNFDPYLAKIMPLSEFDFGALQRYVTSSKDSTLYELAAKLGKKYSGSTSSMTSILSHFHFLLSAWRPINPENLSRGFEPEYKSFTQILRAPAAAFLHVRDGIYAIDADKEYDTANILSMLGKSMEKLLTLPKEDFERYRLGNSDQITEEERNAEEAFHFSTLGDFLMRSQLDATDKRLPGTGMFDLKTRAVVSIRMDAKGFHKGLGYEIRQRFGQWESFEREYYDMIRAAFLKYSLQVRMGRMDGIFVAFHNTQRIFGFQYVPLEEMDVALHGTDNRSLGDSEFKLSLHLLNKALDRATERFPGRPIRLHVETRPGNPPFMYIFAKPVSPGEVETVQNANSAAIAEFENQLMGIQTQDDVDLETSEGEEQQQHQQHNQQSQPEHSQEDDAAESTEETRQQALAYWEEMQDRVDEAVEDDALGINHVREAIQDALEQSDLLKAKSDEEARSYVTSLLEALTRSEEDALKAAESEQLESVTHSAEEAAAEASQAADAGSMSSAKDTAESAAEDGGSRSELSSTTTTSKPSDLSLKELIIRVAERVDEKPDHEDIARQASEDAASDKSKLREFERILSKLVQTSRSTTNEEVPATSAEERVNDPTSLESSGGREAAETAEDGTENGDAAAAAAGDASSSAAPDPTLDVEGDEILGMHLLVRNKVNGEYVERPEVDATWQPLQWTLEYSIEEIPTQSAKTIYQAIQKRRQKALQDDSEGRDKRWNNMFKGKLKQMSQRGRRFREAEEARIRKAPVHVLDQDAPLSFEEAFGLHEQWNQGKEGNNNAKGKDKDKEKQKE